MGILDNLKRYVRGEDGGEALFRSGANAALTGDMLTTTGTDIRSDREMLTALGYQISH